MDARRLKITADRRTSLIVDPADGRIPTLATLPPERQKVRAARAEAAARFAAGLPDDFTDMSLPVRCIIRTDCRRTCRRSTTTTSRSSRAPATSTIAPEMIHSARIIPLDGRPHLDKNLRQWLGDTRGRWEGTTLVVETTNFRAEEGVVFQGANPATFTITERFTRVAAGHHQLRVHDRRSDDVDEAVDGAAFRGTRSIPASRCSSTPVTKTTSTSCTS